MKKTLLQNSKLYVVLSPQDLKVSKISLEEACEALVMGGADIVQLRDKEASTAQRVRMAKRMRPILHHGETLFIMNDDPHAALEAGLDGVHLGQEDLSIDKSRKILPKNTLIGKSTHSYPQALEAVREGAHYIGFGPVFATPTKPTYPQIGLRDIARIEQEVPIPFFAIGGIDPNNLSAVMDAGASRIAIVRAALAEGRIRESVRHLKSMLIKHTKVQSRVPSEKK